MNIIKVSLALIMGVVGVLMTAIHALFSLAGRMFYQGETTVANEEELIRFITERVKDSASIDLMRTGVWILIPALLISFALAILFSRKYSRPLYAWLVLFGIGSVAFFLLAVSVNYVGVQNELGRDLPLWREAFTNVYHPRIKSYYVEDTNLWEHSGRRICWILSDSPHTKEPCTNIMEHSIPKFTTLGETTIEGQIVKVWPEPGNRGSSPEYLVIQGLEGKVEVQIDRESLQLLGPNKEILNQKDFSVGKAVRAEGILIRWQGILDQYSNEIIPFPFPGEVRIISS